MNIRLQVVGYEQRKKSIEDLIQAFFEEPIKFTVDSNIDDLVYDIHIISHRDPCEIKWTSKTIVIRSSDQFTIEHVETETFGVTGLQEIEASVERRNVLRSVLRAMEQMTGWSMPWGILTGIRPTKRLHQLLDQTTEDHAMQILMENYALSYQKAQRIRSIATLQRSLFSNWHELDREVSLYIGIPFCPTKCAYCTFPAYDIRGQQGSVNGFLQGLVLEIRAMGEWFSEHPMKITTVYWGGGTPTSITAEEMNMLYDELHRAIPAVKFVREVTVEAGRPDTITTEKLEVLKKWNVHRISVNPQSFTQETLDLIGRHHTVDETIQAMTMAREHGMDNINMDVIVGLPNEHLEHVQHTLDQIAPWQPESVTVHTLSFKRASTMTKNREEYDVATRDEIHQMVTLTEQWSESNGYVPYYLYRQKNILGNLENVGYSKPDRASLYNILMMEENQTIIGLGCGAVSRLVWPKDHGDDSEKTVKIERIANPKDPRSYMMTIASDVKKKIATLNEIYGFVEVGQ